MCVCACVCVRFETRKTNEDITYCRYSCVQNQRKFDRPSKLHRFSFHVSIDALTSMNSLERQDLQSAWGASFLV